MDAARAYTFPLSCTIGHIKVCHNPAEHIALLSLLFRPPHMRYHTVYQSPPLAPCPIVFFCYSSIAFVLSYGLQHI